MSEEMNLYKRCKNIFKFHGVDMGGGGGESAPEVENAIETHGLGWTGTEEKAGFDIQWDGDTEGLESFGGLVYKMPDGVYVPDVIDDLIGASVTAITGDDSNTYTIDESYIDSLNDDIHFVKLPNDGTGDKINLVLVVLNESYMSGTLFARGIWLVKTDAMYVSRVCKEATTEEVIHQIDQKYIPGGSGGSRFDVTVSMDFQTKEMTADKSFNDILTALESNQNVMAKLMATLGQESQLMGMYPFVAYENGNSIAFGYYYQGDRDGFVLSVECDPDTGEDFWDSAIV